MTDSQRAALAEREAAGWPPFAHVAALRASATELAPRRSSSCARRASSRARARTSNC